MNLFVKDKAKQKKGEQAVKMFHRSPYFYNCAQSILKAFQEEYSVDEDQIEMYMMYGGGRAENGYCGALYAGLDLLKDQPELQEELTNQFKSHTGSLKCRDIRGQRGLPCKKLVELTGDIVESIHSEEKETF